MSELPMLWKEEAEPGIGGTREEYAKFMRRLLKLNMCILRTGRAKATNSVFFLRKPDGRLRFIISALRANELLLKPEYCDLAGPQVLTGIQTTQLPLDTAKSD